MATVTTASLSHEQLLAALERRFDFQSARSVASELLTAAGVARADSYDAAAVGRLRAAAEQSLTRANVVLEALTQSAPVAAAKTAAAAGTSAEAPAAAPEVAAAVDAAPADAADAAADKVEKKKKA